MTDTTPTPNGVPDLFSEFAAKYEDETPTAAAQLIQAEALCRMAAIQQASYGMSVQQAEERRQAREEMNQQLEGLFDDLPFGDDDGTDQYRYDGDDDDDRRGFLGGR